MLFFIAKSGSLETKTADFFASGACWTRHARLPDLGDFPPPSEPSPGRRSYRTAEPRDPKLHSQSSDHVIEVEQAAGSGFVPRDLWTPSQRSGGSGQVVQHVLDLGHGRDASHTSSALPGFKQTDVARQDPRFFLPNNRAPWIDVNRFEFARKERGSQSG